MKVEGVIPAMITPFHKDGEIDEQALRAMVDFLVESGVHGILTAGTIGEFNVINRDERKRIFEVVVDEVNGRTLVFAGTGSDSTREAVSISKDAENVGVDAVTVITPYFVKPSDEELFLHYKTVAEAVSLPVLLYSNPPRTGVTLSPEVVERLAEVDNVAGMKDSSGDFILFQEYLRRVGDRLSVIIGRDKLIYPALTVGARGTVNAVGNFAPKLVLELYEAAKRGDHEGALRLQKRVNIISDALRLGTNPAGIKEAVNLVGKPGGYPRKPVTPLDKAQREILRRALGEAGIL